METELLTVGEAAAKLGVPARSITNGIYTGRLPAYGRLVGDRRLFEPAELKGLELALKRAGLLKLPQVGEVPHAR